MSKKHIDLSEFNVISYPDGHKHIKHDMDLHGVTTITASLCNADDVFLLAQIKQIYPELRHLYIKYLFVGRCDRRFSRGEALDLKIILQWIDYLEFSTVSILQPHSTTYSDYIYRSRSVGLTSQLLKLCFIENNLNISQTIAILPDAGAAENFKWIHEDFVKVIQGAKIRTQFGLNVLFGQNDAELFEIQDTFIIIDDLCDGGATFTDIAATIRSYNERAKIYLVITHAIFSKGLDVFKELIDHIYCTDSFKVINHPLITQIEAYSDES